MDTSVENLFREFLSLERALTVQDYERYHQLIEKRKIHPSCFYHLPELDERIAKDYRKDGIVFTDRDFNQNIFPRLSKYDATIFLTYSVDQSEDDETKY